MKNLANKPFALIGVHLNYDGEDARKVKEVMEKEKLSYNYVCHIIVNRSAQEDNPLAQKAGVYIVSALAKLRAVGATGGEGADFGLVSPIAGVVVERNASPGQVVGPSTNLFTVANLRHVWITVDVYEADLSRVRRGAPVVVTPVALAGETFAGRVTYAGGVVDPASRTFKVRVELENPGLRLRPGMFAQVRITVPPGAAATTGTLTVPEIAIQEINGKQVAFVATASPGQFVARPVTVGPRSSGGLVTLTGGLAAGDRIVGRGAFQLKAEMLKASFGEDQ